MPSAIDPLIRSYLQARIIEWLNEPGHTARQLAALVGVSGTQISDARHKGAVGWNTLQGLLPVLGLTLATLEAEAKAWHRGKSGGAPTATPRTTRVRLRDLAGWTTLADAALAEHGELDAADVDAVGSLTVDTDVLGGPLDVPTIAGLAGVLAARRRRLAKRTTDA